MSANPPEWLVLQKKIFGRWVNQKLARGAEKLHVEDVVTGFSDGLALISLLEVLSGTTFTGPRNKAPKLRVQKVDNVNHALKFVWQNGVEMELHPSAENVVDGDEKLMLGLIWAIMRRFLKFSDDEEEKLNARDALLMWVQNQVHEYPGVKVADFTKSFHDGIALGALVHKFRPKLINFNSLDSKTPEDNLRKVFTAAEKYFGLEQYLAPSDIHKLDEKSMVVYVSDYYYGIASKKNEDLAARRITKLIRWTQENDAMRAEYKEKSTKLYEHIQKVITILNDRTIDNTLAGAQHKLDEFNVYRTKDKGEIVADFLKIEAVYNHLAMRLVDHGRPLYNAGPNLSVKEHSDALQQLEVVEQERNIALNAELNRQKRLVQLNIQHTARSEKLSNWLATKLEYLREKENVQSSGAALFFLNKLSAYRDEERAIKESSFAELKRVGADLAANSYENQASVQEREAKIDASFDEANNLATHKKAVLEDDLARELYKEPIVLLAQQHAVKFEDLKNWVATKTAYLEQKDDINSISEAKLQLSLLDAYEREKEDVSNSTLRGLKEIGKKVLDAQYTGPFSSWAYENPAQINDRHSHVDEQWTVLSQLHQTKKATLDDALEKETKKERLRLSFANTAGDFARWAKDLIEEAGNSQFGFTLSEVQEYGQKLQVSDAAAQQQAQEKRASYTQIHEELASFGQIQNVYTTLTPAELNSTFEALQNALAARQQTYQAELARWLANDALCKKFAELVIPFTESLKAHKQQLTESKAPLEEQVKQVEARMTSNDNAALPEINNLQSQIEQAGVTNNNYTGLTATDAQVQFQQYEAFLARKKKSLEEEIEHHSLRGLTKEQFAEIQAQFKRFDKDQNGSLDKHEFRACLYSLNDDRPTKEVYEIMTQYGSRQEGIRFEGFKEFMIKQLGDSDTKEEIITGFQLINKGEPVAKVEYINDILADPDVEYLVKTAPPADGGLDYRAWSEDVFSR